MSVLTDDCLAPLGNRSRCYLLLLLRKKESGLIHHSQVFLRLNLWWTDSRRYRLFSPQLQPNGLHRPPLSWDRREVRRGLLSESVSPAPASPELCACGSSVFPVLRRAFTEDQWGLGPSKRHSEEETAITQWWGKDITSSIVVFRTPVHICWSAEEQWLEWEDSKHLVTSTAIQTRWDPLLKIAS